MLDVLVTLRTTAKTTRCQVDPVDVFAFTSQVGFCGSTAYHQSFPQLLAETFFDLFAMHIYTLCGKYNGVGALTTNPENFQPEKFLDRRESNPSRPACKAAALCIRLWALRYKGIE